MKPYLLVDYLLRPLRWLMTETAKTVHRLRGRRGQFWERRYRVCLVDDRATYAWSSCAAYTLGTPSCLIWMPGTPGWARQRAVGSAAFLTRYLRPRGRRRSVPVPLSVWGVRAKVRGESIMNTEELRSV